MHITRYTDYSLRVMMYLALKGDELSTIKEIADAYGISKNHLMKVVQDLNIKGYLTATRGKSGGICLTRPAESINIGALVRDMEGDLDLVECFTGSTDCIITPSCHLKRVFADALKAFLEVYTLADLLPRSRKPKLLQLLQITDTGLRS